jgi:hypothetical protein
MGIFRDVCPFFGEQQKLRRERHVEIYFRPSGAPFLDGSTFRHHLYIRNDAVCNIFYLSACLNSELWPSATNQEWKHLPCKTVFDRLPAFGKKLRADEICAVLGCYAACSGKSLPTFRNKQSVPSSSVKKSK